MSNTSNMDQRLHDGAAVELTGKIMIIAIIVLFLVVVFIFLLHIYSKWFWYRHTFTSRTTTRHPTHPPTTTTLRRGLETSTLKSIPILIFPQPHLPTSLECTVCLSDITEGEKLRLLPTCNHGFHVECIDMWFQSHSTCPVCRNSVSESSMHKQSTQENANIPTNVLFWGNETQDNVDSTTSSSSTLVSSSLVIDIPSSINEDEEQKSPMPPSRMRSLKRLLSRDRRSNPSSPRIVA